MKILLSIIYKILFFIVGAYALLIGLGFYLSPQTALSNADAIVVVSGGETDLRTLEGVRVFQQGYADRLIFSGAAKAGPSNAVAMRQIALKEGVDDTKIILEEEGEDTFGNAAHTLDILEGRDWHKIILVTSPYHQRRAYVSFNREAHKQNYDLTIINHSAMDSAWRKNGWWLDAWARGITLSEVQKLIAIHALDL